MHDSIQIQILEELSYSFLLSYIQQHFNKMSEFKTTQADSTECKQENYNARQSLLESSKPQAQKTEHRNDSENVCRQSVTYQEEPREDIRVRSRRTYNVITNVQTEIENTIKKEILNMKSCLENQLIHIRKHYANLGSKLPADTSTKPVFTQQQPQMQEQFHHEVPPSQDPLKIQKEVLRDSTESPFLQCQHHNQDQIRQKSRKAYSIMANAQVEIQNLIKNEMTNLKSQLQSQLTDFAAQMGKINRKVSRMLTIQCLTRENHQEGVSQALQSNEVKTFDSSQLKLDQQLQDGYIIDPNGDIFRVKKVDFQTRKKTQREQSHSHSRSRSSSRSRNRKRHNSDQDSQQSKYGETITNQQKRSIVRRIKRGKLSIKEAAQKCGKIELAIEVWMKIYQ